MWLLSKHSPAIELFDSLTNLYLLTLIVGFNNEDNCGQSQEFEKSIKDMLLKGILSIGFWQVYHE